MGVTIKTYAMVYGYVHPLLSLATRDHTAKMESTGGEAKTSPQIAAVSIPSPTNPA